MVLRGLKTPFSVRDDCVVHPDGSTAIVVRADGVDLASLDEARRRAALGAFANLLHSLEAPLQLLIRTRPLQPATHENRATSPLDEAMRRHRLHRQQLVTPHHRDLLLVTRAASGADAERALQRIVEALRAMGVMPRRLGGAALHEVLGDDLSLQWTESATCLRIGDRLAAGLALRRLPGHAVAAGWLQPLLTVRAWCDIAIHLVPAPLGLALRSLTGRLRDFSAHRLLETERGAVGDVHVDIALDAAFALRGRLARHHGRPLRLSLTVMAQAPTHRLLAEQLHMLRTAFQGTLALSEPLHFRHAAARITTLPLGLDAVGAAKLVDSTAAATCAPWFDASCDEPGGYRLGETRTSQLPLCVAPFDTSRHDNANISVLAASGHGKSFALGTLLIEASLQGVDAIVIDPEGEYERVARALDGTTASLAPGCDAALNVFDSETGGDGGAAAAAELIAVMCDKLSDSERAGVDAATRHAVERAATQQRAALLSDCLPGLAAFPRVRAVLDRHCDGPLGALFNRSTTLRFTHGIHAVSLRDMPAEHLPAATHLLARTLWSLLLRDPRRRHIVFDEAGALCAHPALRSLLVQLARRCRKHGASLVVATQNAQDLLSSDEGTVVVTNSAVVLLGGQRPADVARMEHAFGLTAGQRRFLENAARGEFLLIAGSRRLEMRVDVPPEYAALVGRDTQRDGG